jgi:hypothetical protein
MTDPTHPCPGGCRARVPYHRYACRPCWRRLPHRLRQAIVTTWRTDPPAHRRAIAEAAGWYAARRQ